ncbi:MAG: CHAP domain-containing protein [Planctomycetota bacterium]|nr:MAG: CHAP domain-containing protein [Planctomycetota bacterium]
MMDPVPSSGKPAFEPLDPALAPGTQAPLAQGDEAALEPAPAAQTPDPAQSAAAWTAHQLDPTAQSIEQLTRVPPDSYFTPDAVPLEEFYAGAPAGTAALDAQLEQVGALLQEVQAHLEKATAALGAQTGGPTTASGTPAETAQAPLPPALQGDAAARLSALGQIAIPADLRPEVAGPLREAVGQLATELARPQPDVGRVAELARRCDQLVVEAVAGRENVPMQPLAQALGSSLLGGGAVGNLLPAPIREQALTPPGYERLDGARDGFYLSNGASGPEVEALERALNQAGYGPLAVDGRFDGELAAVVRRFQAENGCTVDGIVGPETLGALDARLGLPRRSGPGVPRGDYTTPTEFPPGQPVPPGQHNRIGALQAAITQLGVREATGNNDGVPARRYSGGRNVPWCANFVAWAFRQAGTPLPGNQWSLGSVDYMMNQMKSAGAFFPRGGGQPQPGDIIFFGVPGDGTHVGLVERVANGRVYTVEGNTGNRVARRSYPLDAGKILGYGRP